MKIHWSSIILWQYSKELSKKQLRFTQLVKNATGELKDLTKGYIQLPAKDSYEVAKN